MNISRTWLFPFSSMVEPRSIHKDETVTIDWDIVQSDGANLIRAGH